jgi:hypothetical protein
MGPGLGPGLCVGEADSIQTAINTSEVAMNCGLCFGMKPALRKPLWTKWRIVRIGCHGGSQLSCRLSSLPTESQELYNDAFLCRILN